MYSLTDLGRWEEDRENSGNKEPEAPEETAEA